MEDVTVEITGLSELEDALERLGGEQARTITKEGLKQGGVALQEAMMVECSADVKGEARQLLTQKSGWSKSVKMEGDLSGRVRVGPKGSLVELHVARGHGRQPKGHIYRRSLKYLVKLMEFGGNSDDARALNVGRTAPMTRGFEVYKGAVLERVIAVIKDLLQLSDAPSEE